MAEKPYFENVVGPQFAGWTLLEFYARRYGRSSPEAWRNRIEDGLVTRNGEPAAAGDVLSTGDVLRFHRGERDEPPVDTRYRIVFEDGDIIVVDKPSGLPVMPGGRYLRHTLLTLLREEREGLPVHPAHRIDRDTSGLVVFTRNTESARRMAAAFRNREVGKEYDALLLGRLAGEVTVDRAVRVVAAAGPGGARIAGGSDTAPGKEAVTRFVPVFFRGDLGLTRVRAVPLTGRKHQIRFHAALIGHPILGDALYGGTGALPGRAGSPGCPGGLIDHRRLPGVGRLALHAATITIPAGTGFRTFRSRPPAWFENPLLVMGDGGEA